MGAGADEVGAEGELRRRLRSYAWSLRRGGRLGGCRGEWLLGVGREGGVEFDGGAVDCGGPEGGGHGGEPGFDGFEIGFEGHGADDVEDAAVFEAEVAHEEVGGVAGLAAVEEEAAHPVGFEEADVLDDEVVVGGEVLEPFDERAVGIGGAGADGEGAGAIRGDGGDEGEEEVGVFVVEGLGRDVGGFPGGGFGVGAGQVFIALGDDLYTFGIHAFIGAGAGRELSGRSGK